jgi:type IV pilus assembly protein PilX
MKYRAHPGSRRQQGIVLITSMIILVVMTLFALTAVRMVSQQERMAGYSYDRSLAFQAAEAALREAESLVESAKPQPATGASCGSVAVTSAASVQMCGAPAAVTTTRWTDPAFTGWANATAVGSGSLAVTPQYFVEYMGAVYPCKSEAVPLTNNCKRYRITARAGDAGRAKVMVQSLYATD